MRKRLVFFAILIVISLPVFAQSAATSTAATRDPRVVFGRSLDARSTATIAEVLVNPRVSIDMPGFKVTNFSFSLQPDKGDYWGPFTVKGGELTQKIKEELRTVAGKSGRIFIEDVKAIGPDRRPRAMNSIIITYTN